ncbi:nucleolar protein 10 [Cylas formicarius]|uniref:nucleolar protein 10 n=1 Tax=Cylas formicarius TaxID=197179 RepID=UPI002958BBFB|nr:nucleolar protein 10 [Cylas formicarius]
MEVSQPNEVKIYNLSAGKVLPEWLSERKRRALLKKNVDLRRQIELIQDFDMPGLSHTVKVSRDGQYILATGTYKPRVKCFDVNNLSLKFERCFDSDAVTFEILSDDYSKLVFLQCDRYVEFHVAHGRYHRMRIPKYGRDMRYHYQDCDLYVVGASSDIYRINLERGQFLTPFQSKASDINRCTINPVHNLLMCGTQEGRVEAWDPRVKEMVGSLDCAFQCLSLNKEIRSVPSVTALKCNGALQMGAGTATGQVLLYDLRSDKPYTVKDHLYGFAIRDVDFHHQQDLVMSLDRSVLKIWNQNDGKIYTSIESSADFNNLCVVPNTGLLFLANEAPKMLTYYIPSLGAAPKWAGFLDSLTEELEESNVETVYDDYKFVDGAELESLGLEHLIGTPLLRAYMHGYFVDVRLYNKAKSIAEPFKFEEYRKKKIRETIEQERGSRVQVERLPKVNRELALKLMEDAGKSKKKKGESASLLSDGRFKALFENPDFEVDKTTDEYRLLNPVLSKLGKTKKAAIPDDFETVEDKLEERDEGIMSDDFASEESSDDEHQWTAEVKKEYRTLQRERRAREREEEEEEEEPATKQPKLYEMRHGEEYTGLDSFKRKPNKLTLGERLEDESQVRMLGSIGNREMSFSTVRKSNRTVEIRNKRHVEERRRIVRKGFKQKPGLFSQKRR